MNVKICKKCGIEKPTSEFSPAKENKDRLNSWCKQCHREYQSSFRDSNPEEAKIRRDKQYQRLKQLGGYQVVYKQSFEKAQRKYRLSEKGRASHKIRQHSYRKTSRGQTVLKKSIQKRSLIAKGTFSVEQWNLLLRYYCPNGICPGCGKEERMTIDHVIPLVMNGANTIDNIQPLCKSCNSRKHSSIADYRHDKGKFASLLMEA